MKYSKKLVSYVFAIFFISFYSAAFVFAQVKLTPEYFVSKNFKLKSGEFLEEIKIEYATWGIPLKNSSGDIINGVVFCHGSSGNYSQGITFWKGMLGSGKPLDPEKYFLIFPTALGSPGSSSPSVSKLGYKFPQYTVSDMVSAQYLLVTEHFGIKHLAGVVGASMGGQQTLQWITQYPDFMDWAIPIATSPSTTGRKVGIYLLMAETIKSDPAYKNGKYKLHHPPKDGLKRALMGTYLWFFSYSYYQMNFRTPMAMMKALEDYGLESEKMDANDLIWRNHALMSYDVTSDLGKVKARTLVIGVNTDELDPPEEFFRVVMGIPGAKLFAYDSIFGHVGCAFDIEKANQAMIEHLK